MNLSILKGKEIARSQSIDPLRAQQQIYFDKHGNLKLIKPVNHDIADAQEVERNG